MNAEERPCQGILLIEDDADLMHIEAQLLRDEGYQVTAAANGQEALDILRAPAERLPCVILLDLMMPVMDGWQFRAEQVQDPRLAMIPVVIVTADGRAAEKNLGLDGVAALMKPVTLNELLDTVQTFCGAPRRQSTE